MRALLVISALVLSACQPSMTDAYAELFQDGNWASMGCDQPILTIDENQINDGEIVCQVDNISTNSKSMITISGKQCVAEGNALSDFKFQFDPISTNQFRYKNSGESVWQTITFCPKTN